MTDLVFTFNLTKHNDYYNKILRATKYILPNSKKKNQRAVLHKKNAQHLSGDKVRMTTHVPNVLKNGILKKY